MTDPVTIRRDALQEAFDLCRREANLYLDVADMMTGRERRDRRAKAAAANAVAEMIRALIERA